MKKNISIPLLLVLITCVSSFTASAQITPARMLEFISENRHINKADVYELYSRLNYQPIWIQNKNTINRDILLQTLKQAADFGLSEKDYQFDFIASFRNR